MSGLENDLPRGLATRAVHAGEPTSQAGCPVVNPIYQVTTFYSDPEDAGEVLYTRYGNNPNHLRLQERICALEGAEACVVTASGMSALVAALLACVRSGDHVLAGEGLYGGTRVLLDRELSRLGIESSYTDLTADGWERDLRANTRVVLAETLSNPLLRFTDPARLAPAAHAAGAALVVDATFTPAPLLRALERGADLVVHSATKYLGGHSDVTAGVVCGGAEPMQSVLDRARIFGAALDPHAAWLLERGIKTLPLRMERHSHNGLAVARWCAEQPEFARVHYPGLASHPDHAAATSLLGGYGGMLSLELRGGDAAVPRFLAALRLAKVAPSLGGVETLASEPRYTSHASMSPEHRRAIGIGDGFVRFSLGIEDAEDLIADIRQALDAAG